ncbi:MerR family DNA-binding transcriptional regulator [Halobacillus shinanisalinarum]|uniref:MerR family DNA-binding transcriptional regulator n=1 Tax=Halobacillus shinanisalinarum TaxID=2932258 RepID=A0ABY4H3A1_9BACI|nr:MerR family DNA-binding transcriptional regulator [Halobacillus shinanisalinarum]UOQ94804.1 MerR family DNA-binding transcriptional regulator [Halobacillus shinanisalinarum]
MKSKLSIGELAKESGVSSSAIRYYESIGVLPEPERLSGKRRYIPDVVHQLKFIKTAQLVGFNNKEIAALVEGFSDQHPPSENWKRMAEWKRSELEEKKRQMDLMINILQKGLSCKCLTWSDCYDKIQESGTCS